MRTINLSHGITAEQAKRALAFSSERPSPTLDSVKERGQVFLSTGASITVNLEDRDIGPEYFLCGYSATGLDTKVILDVIQGY